jgi:hypothetical protein
LKDETDPRLNAQAYEKAPAKPDRISDPFPAPFALCPAPCFYIVFYKLIPKEDLTRAQRCLMEFNEKAFMIDHFQKYC